MKDRFCRRLIPAIVVFVAFCGSPTFADQAQLGLCKNVSRGREFNPAEEFFKSTTTSVVGVQSGRTLSAVSAALAINGYFLREAGIVAGRILVWIFDATNPFIVAVGFIIDPTATAKCDTPLTNGPDCKPQVSCVQILSILPAKPTQ